MANTHGQFEMVLEPDETWMIWDNSDCGPASFRGVPMVGLSVESARTYCRVREASNSSFALAS